MRAPHLWEARGHATQSTEGMCHRKVQASVMTVRGGRERWLRHLILWGHGGPFEIRGLSSHRPKGHDCTPLPHPLARTTKATWSEASPGYVSLTRSMATRVCCHVSTAGGSRTDSEMRTWEKVLQSPSSSATVSRIKNEGAKCSKMHTRDTCNKVL